MEFAVIWYRSVAVAGAVAYLRGVKRVFNAEVVLFTMGAGAADAGRVAALLPLAEIFALQQTVEGGGMRIYTTATELFQPVEPAVSRGLGAYQVGVRVADRTVGKIPIGRLGRSTAAVSDAVLGALRAIGGVVERVKAVFG